MYGFSTNQLITIFSPLSPLWGVQLTVFDVWLCPVCEPHMRSDISVMCKEHGKNRVKLAVQLQGNQ